VERLNVEIKRFDMKRFGCGLTSSVVSGAVKPFVKRMLHRALLVNKVPVILYDIKIVDKKISITYYLLS